MKLLVCIKQVVDTSKMEVDPNTGRLNRNGANSILNPCDRNALEAALALRDAEGGSVTVITMGPPQAGVALKEAGSMGADDLYLVTDRAFGGADTLATSYTLSSVIKKLGDFDLIFCGVESIDSNTAQVGPEVAAMLGIPSVSAAVSLSYAAGKLTVTRANGEDRDVLELSLPAVVTATPALNAPRYPSIMGILKKPNMEIHQITAADLDVEADRIGIKGSPTQVKGVRPVVPAKKESLHIEGEEASAAASKLAEALVKIL